MTINALRRMTSVEVWSAVDGFSARYANDWNEWLAASPSMRPVMFGQILRRWQATRPLPMRRLRREATHAPPYLDDLLAAAAGPLAALGDMCIQTVGRRTAQQERALCTL